MTDTTLDQQPPSSNPTRRRTDADRLADMQAELARLKAAGEAKARAAAQASTETDSPKPARARATRGRAKAKRAATPARGEADLDAELHALVEGFVAALRDVIRRELVAQATKKLE